MIWFWKNAAVLFCILLENVNRQHCGSCKMWNIPRPAVYFSSSGSYSLFQIRMVFSGHRTSIITVMRYREDVVECFSILVHIKTMCTWNAGNEKFVNGRENLCSLLKLNYMMTFPWYVANPEGDEINSPPMSADISAETDQCQAGMQIRNLSRQELNVN